MSRVDPSGPFDSSRSGRAAGPVAQDSDRHPDDRLPRVLSLWDASMLIVASVVGSGIFFTPARVAALLPGADLILLAWLVGAMISLAGAFANAELGAMFPRAGGNYVFLREGLHPAAGFLVGWLTFFAIYAGTIAALAVVLAESIAPGLDRVGILLIASLLILGCSLLNLRGTRLAAAINNLTSTTKIAAILLFVVVGPLIGEGSFVPWSDGAASAAAGASSDRSAGPWLAFGQALSPVLFSYLGWNASVYVASEIEEPTRNVPRSLFLGLGLCAGLYLLINGVYLYALTPAELRASVDAGAAAADALFGAAGGRMVAAFVLLAVLGTLNATILVGPRIVYAMALDGHFIRSGNRLHEGFQTPSVAIGVQAAVSILLVALLETFPRALDFTVFGIVLATSADTVALFTLRRRQPERPRPYRAFGYPWVPAGYLGINLAIGTAIAIGSPRACLTTFGLLALGLLLYRRFAR